MRKVNTNNLEEEIFISPGGKFGSGSKEISIALGRNPGSTDLKERHPFDVEICRITRSGLVQRSLCEIIRCVARHLFTEQNEFAVTYTRVV